MMDGCLHTNSRPQLQFSEGNIQRRSKDPLADPTRTGESYR